MIFLLCKVFEYVSQTVVRQKITDIIRTKLMSPSAIEPNANYILELENLFEEQKTFKKDREAIKLTIVTCCDSTELAKVSPCFSDKLKSRLV